MQTLTAVCNALKIDPEDPSPGSRILRKMGTTLVTAMQDTRSGCDPEAAQVVAYPSMSGPSPSGSIGLVR